MPAGRSSGQPDDPSRFTIDEEALQGATSLDGVKALILVAALGVAASIGTAAASAAPPVTVLSPESLTVSAVEVTPATVAVRNDGAAALTLKLTAVLNEGTADVEPGQLTVEGFKVG